MAGPATNRVPKKDPAMRERGHQSHRGTSASRTTRPFSMRSRTVSAVMSAVGRLTILKCCLSAARRVAKTGASGLAPVPAHTWLHPRAILQIRTHRLPIPEIDSMHCSRAAK